jgi:hypothetical protein
VYYVKAVFLLGTNKGGLQSNKLGLLDKEVSPLTINWKHFACSLSGALACPVACLSFAVLPPVMAACKLDQTSYNRDGSQSVIG